VTAPVPPEPQGSVLARPPLSELLECPCCALCPEHRGRAEEYLAANGTTLGEAGERYRATLEPGSHALVEFDAHWPLVRERLGHELLVESAPRSLDRLLEEFRADITRRDERRSASDVNKFVSLPQRIGNWTVQVGIVDRHGWGGWNKKPKPRRLTQSLTDDQLESLLRAAAEHRKYPHLLVAIILLITDCFFSRLQITKLTWDQFEDRRALLLEERSGQLGVRRILTRAWRAIERFRPTEVCPGTRVLPTCPRQLHKILVRLGVAAGIPRVEGFPVGVRLLERTGRRRLEAVGLHERTVEAITGRSLSTLAQDRRPRASDAEVEAGFERHDILRGGAAP
jgi:integrase